MTIAASKKYSASESDGTETVAHLSHAPRLAHEHGIQPSYDSRMNVDAAHDSGGHSPGTSRLFRLRRGGHETATTLELFFDLV